MQTKCCGDDVRFVALVVVVFDSIDGNKMHYVVAAPSAFGACVHNDAQCILNEAVRFIHREMSL